MSKKQRFAWLLLTALFIFTGVGLGVWAFWQDTHPSKDTQSQTTTPQTNNQKQENKLKGTPLANFTPIAKVDTLQKIDTTVGTGDEAKAGSTVTVQYTGALASTGIVFESSLDNGGQPVTFPLAQVIKGWQEGIPGMKAGGTRRLLIPSALAYGSQGSGAIPPNSDLVFDVTLLSVK